MVTEREKQLEDQLKTQLKDHVKERDGWMAAFLIIIFIFVLTLLFVCCMFSKKNSQLKAVKKMAVERGCASWIVNDATGETTFYLKNFKGVKEIGEVE